MDRIRDVARGNGRFRARGELCGHRLSTSEKRLVRVPLLDLRAQYDSIRDDVEAAVREVLESQAFVLGTAVDRFEREMEIYTGARHAIGVASGSDALLLALMALGVGAGDAVVTSSFSFFAT